MLPPFRPNDRDPSPQGNTAPNPPTPATIPRKIPHKAGFLHHLHPPTTRFLLLGALLLIAAFHQPIGRFFLVSALQLAARSQGLSLQATLQGNPFRELRFSQIRLLPNGRKPSPLTHATISKLHLKLNLSRLFSHHPEKCVAHVALENADLQLQPLPSARQGAHQKKPPLQDLHRFLTRPLKTPGSIALRNFNLQSVTPAGPLQISQLNLALPESGSGSLELETLQIPNLPPFQSLRAKIQVQNGKLQIGPAGLNPALVIDQIEVIPASPEHPEGTGSVTLLAFGGSLRLQLGATPLPNPASPVPTPDTSSQNAPSNTAKRTPTPFQTRIQARIEKIDLHALALWLNRPKPPVRWLENGELSFSGNPELPRTWITTTTALFQDLALGPFQWKIVQSEIHSADGQIQFSTTSTDPQSASLTWTGTGILPDRWQDLSSTELDSQIRTIDLAKNPDLNPTSTLNVTGQLQVKSGFATVDAKIAGTDAQIGPLTAAQSEIQLRATLPLWTGPGSKAQSGLSGTAELRSQNLQVRQLALDSIHATVALENSRLELGSLQIQAGNNLLQGSGGFQLQAPLKLWPPATGDFQFALDAPELTTLQIAPLSGQLNAKSHWAYAKDQWVSQNTLTSQNLQIAGVQVETAQIRCASKNKTLDFQSISARFPKNGSLQATLLCPSLHPSQWSGNADLQIPDLEHVFKLSQKSGEPESIRGKLSATWNRPDALSADSAGNLQLNLDQFRLGGLRVDQSRIAATYSGQTFKTSECTIQTEKTRFTAQIQGSKNQLEIQNLTLDQGPIRMLSGDGSIPLLETPAGWRLNPDAAQSAALHAMNLDLDTVASSFGLSSPVSGTCSASFFLYGTPTAPIAKLLLAAKNLGAKKLPLLTPAELSLDADYQEESVGIGLELKHRDTAPIAIRGRSHILLKDMIQHRGIPPDAPLDVTLRAPKISLTLLPKILPALRRAEGICSTELHLGGSISQPDLRGKMDLQADYLRLTGEEAPPIDSVRIQAALAGNSIRIQRADATLGGGRLELLGSLIFANLARPAADLRIRCKDVLAHRTENLTIRVDSDLKLAGPLASAAASGSLWLTHSKFSRDIDILPIGLPGKNRPRPKPAAPPAPPSFRSPPLRDCTLDIRILTRTEDPFRIRGNLAQGSANIGLHLGGTGFRPELSGKITIENFTASLPFSRLHVSSGQALFDPAYPFVPQLDLHAESEVRDYRIYAHLSGTTENKKIELISEPPLDQNDIVSLLATGTTSAELNGNNDVLAGKAAVLVFQQLYRKVFKQQDPSEEQTLFDRLQIDIGGVDNRTGKQEISARFKLGDQFYLTGDLDVAGNFNGKIRYLLRYR